MAKLRSQTYGRAAMIGVLVGLLLLVSAGAYVYVARFGPQVFSPTAIDDPALEAQRLTRLTVLLTILLISALLILLFVLGSYLLIRIGRIVQRPLGGKPTEYVDAWSRHHVTDEQIAAATSEPEYPDGSSDELPPRE